MYDELKANVFPKLPRRIVQMSVFVREMKRPNHWFLAPLSSPLPLSCVVCVILPGFIFLHTPTRWTETAKKECMQNILEYFLYNSQPTAMWTFGKLTCILFTCHLLLFILSDCCSFVLSPFVKLFLNVYTWFWNCLFCTFNFYNPTVQAFPHDVLKTILF